MSIRRVHHLQITIPRGAEEEGRRFYCGVLGLVEIAKPVELQGRGGFWLAVGHMQLHVGTEDGNARSASRAHVAYQVSDLAAWKARLQAAAVVIADAVPIAGLERFEFRDPFGNRIEFVEPNNT